MWWPNQSIAPRRCIDLAVATKALGYELRYEERLAFTVARTPFRVAGLLDPKKKLLLASLEFGPEVANFTVAHEVGHILLHPDVVMHRERPISDLNYDRMKREPKEQEADHFAACFLMPEALLRDSIAYHFETTLPFKFDEASAFELSRRNPQSVLRPHQHSLAPELALASAQHYRGRHFDSLASQFGVTKTAMALRLRELALVNRE